MPWKAYGKCVHKVNADGSQGEQVPGGCHATHEEAVNHAKAMNANYQGRAGTVELTNPIEGVVRGYIALWGSSDVRDAYDT